MKKNNKKIIKNLGGNFILWILIIVISLSILQYLTTNKKSVNISYKTFHNIVESQSDNIKKIVIEGRFASGECYPSCINQFDNN